MKHPIQPLYTDKLGTVRFKANAVVQYLLDSGPFDMNHLARQDFSDEDREQFAQLIGYSLGGYADLPYVSDEAYEAARRMYENDQASNPAQPTDKSRRIWQTSLTEFAPFYAYWWRDGEWLRSEEIQPDANGVSSVDVPEEPGHYLLTVYGSGGTVHFRQEVFVEANSDPA